MLEQFQKYQVKSKHKIVGGTSTNSSGNFITSGNRRPPSAPIFSSN